MEHLPIPGRSLVVVGTRPEAVKLAPLVLEIKKRRRLRALVVATGQHSEMVRQMLDFFDVPIDVELVGATGDLADAAASIQAQLAEVIRTERIETVIVQGDTVSATAGALAGFYLQRPVHHVEAGLRSGDLTSPFPEEANRRLISVVAAMHYAPTATARDALLRESVPTRSIAVTGNTGIDALLLARDVIGGTVANNSVLRETIGRVGRLMVVTAHRRESWGTGLSGIAEGVRRIADRHPDLSVLLPVHRNPVVRNTLVTALAGVPRVLLTEPLDYPDMVRALSRATLVVTDSGGIQEEAVTLGVPTLVTRSTTERAEGVAAAGLRLVGTDPHIIAREAHLLLSSAPAHAALSCATMPFGDGRAAGRIADHLERPVARSTRPRPAYGQMEIRLPDPVAPHLEGVHR